MPRWSVPSAAKPVMNSSNPLPLFGPPVSCHSGPRLLLHCPGDNELPSKDGSPTGTGTAWAASVASQTANRIRKEDCMSNTRGDPQTIYPKSPARNPKHSKQIDDKIWDTHYSLQPNPGQPMFLETSFCPAMRQKRRLSGKTHAVPYHVSVLDFTGKIWDTHYSLQPNPGQPMFLETSFCPAMRQKRRLSGKTHAVPYHVSVLDFTGAVRPLAAAAWRTFRGGRPDTSFGAPKHGCPISMERPNMGVPNSTPNIPGRTP
jgi:hypothetical protein